MSTEPGQEVADTGFEYQRVFEANPGKVRKSASGHDGVCAVKYEGKAAFRGARAKVNSFVSEVRQDLGPEDTEAFFNFAVHDRPPAAADGGVRG